jgi:hypothetical protein
MTPKDPLSFVGDPPLWRPNAYEVHVSVTFTWDVSEGLRLAAAWADYYPVVKLGGPAFGDCLDSFIPGFYIKPGVTFTTRGCNNRCPWCLVPNMEGQLIEISNFSSGWIIQDNNLLQASQRHIIKVLAMLRSQSKPVILSGGLQSSLVSDWFAEELRTIRINQIFLAADTLSAINPLKKAIKKLEFLGRRKLRAYVMIGRNETIMQAKERLQEVWDIGCLPFAQLYQPAYKFIRYSWDWLDLARTWSRPAIMFSNQERCNPALPHPAAPSPLSHFPLRRQVRHSPRCSAE